ncbi:MAG: CPBP family intramembrane glutamic endopeptidase [Chloroflexota bacterium]
MLFYAKQHARSAVLVMIGLMLVSNLWASARNIALGDMLWLDLPGLLAGLLGIMFVVSLDSIIYMVNWFVGFHPFLDRFDSAITKLFGSLSPFAPFAGGLLAALGEETFFRGILQNEFGLVPTAILFALAHIGRGFNLFAVWALLEGLIFGWLYQLTGNLFVPMLAHGVHDTAGMFMGRYLYKRSMPPAPTLFDWLAQLNQPAARLPAPQPPPLQLETPTAEGESVPMEEPEPALQE